MKGAHSFLPGGGVEIGEGAQTALKREMEEELGITSCEIIRFLGVIEFELKEKDYHEKSITHLFEVSCNELTSSVTPISLEPHLEFYWLEPTEDNLKKNNVLPYLVQGMIPRILNEDKPIWVSNM